MTKPVEGVTTFSSFSGYAFLAAGLCCGIRCATTTHDRYLFTT